MLMVVRKMCVVCWPLLKRHVVCCAVKCWNICCAVLTGFGKCCVNRCWKMCFVLTGVKKGILCVVLTSVEAYAMLFWQVLKGVLCQQVLKNVLCQQVLKSVVSCGDKCWNICCTLLKGIEKCVLFQQVLKSVCCSNRCWKVCCMLCWQVRVQPTAVWRSTAGLWWRRWSSTGVHAHWAQKPRSSPGLQLHRRWPSAGDYWTARGRETGTEVHIRAPIWGEDCNQSVVAAPGPAWTEGNAPFSERLWV